MSEEEETCKDGEHLDICEKDLVCLVCGESVLEDVMAAAYDRAKDIRKYGPNG